MQVHVEDKGTFREAYTYMMKKQPKKVCACISTARGYVYVQRLNYGPHSIRDGTTTYVCVIHVATWSHSHLDQPVKHT